MTDCIFCKIAAGEIPATFVYRDELVVAFRDVAPQAPTHVLVVPRRHVADADALEPADEALVGRMALVAARLARELGVAADGYRLVLNTGPHGGQVVPHLHLHLLAGRPLAAELG